jgi:hypothetical protein
LTIIYVDLELFIKLPAQVLRNKIVWLKEKKNRHLLDVTGNLMFAMIVPKYLWSEAIMTSAYLINRMSSRVLEHKTPMECLTSKNTFVVPLKVLGEYAL